MFGFTHRGPKVFSNDCRQQNVVLQVLLPLGSPKNYFKEGKERKYRRDKGKEEGCMG
jgi:hypothetical protein